MGWLLLAALGIMWAAFLLPRGRGSAHRSVEDFERNMGLLADTGLGGQGRWIVTPRKGMAFVGPRERAKERARQRRRRVFVFLLESIGLTGLIGLVPPLRVMWYATGLLLVLLGAYVWLLVSLRVRGERAELGRATAAAEPSRPARERYATDAGARTARPAFNGLAAFGGDDLASIVVRPAGREVGVARA
jgi:hypothetical protein